MSNDRTRGLYEKYRVERIDGKPLKGGMCIVLELGDPNARPALLMWARTMQERGFEALSDDMFALLEVPDDE